LAKISLTPTDNIPAKRWVLTGDRNVTAYLSAGLLSITDGRVETIRGLKPEEPVLGWDKDDELYVESKSSTPTMLHIEKLNPFTGARVPWRDLPLPAIGGIIPAPPIITFDGSTYGYDYRLRLADLYTVNGVD
jgi:hypothetical protein